MRFTGIDHASDRYLELCYKIINSTTVKEAMTYLLSPMNTGMVSNMIIADSLDNYGTLQFDFLLVF